MISKGRLQRNILLIIIYLCSCIAGSAQRKDRPINIIYILSDDHRYDAMGFTNKIPGLETPGMDMMAREGVHLKNAFVTTALCSPSRASILTGQYAHTHKIVDNNAPIAKGLTYFPSYLQKKGYKTAFFGKWHMGNTDDQPQPGFDHWLSFRGQGVYYSPTFNINGERIRQADSSYTTDLLTEHAIEWMNSLKKDQPFFVYLSHKGVHAEFYPAKRHAGKYKHLPVIAPPSMYLTVTDSSKTYGRMQAAESKVNFTDIPKWVREQRYSWHGVDYMYDGAIPFDEFYKRYLETLQAVDESILKVIEWVKEKGLQENTLVVYMGDNGFSFGEHGLIDKRHAYEESMRVPLLCWSPGLLPSAAAIPEMIMNVDIAPTFLQVAGINKPSQMEGQSFLPLLKGQKMQWRKYMFYEYYWESAFPQTPTIFAARSDRYKYIYNHGVWDINELYDLQEDPYEMNNLIRSLEHNREGRMLRDTLFNWLEKSNGLSIPLNKASGTRFDHKFRGTY